MIQLTVDTPVLLATQPADFRKGIDGLVALCRQVLARDPMHAGLFVFINRRRTMIRALTYDGTGFWLMTKRLSKGRFIGWPSPHEPVSSLAAWQLRRLLQGLEPGHDLPAALKTTLNYCDNGLITDKESVCCWAHE